MKWKDLKIGYKIGVGFATMIMLSLIIGIIAFINMNKIQNETKKPFRKIHSNN